MNMEDWWNYSLQGNTKVIGVKKNLSTTKPTCTVPGLNPGLCSKKLETNYLNYGTAKKNNLCQLYEYCTYL